MLCSKPPHRWTVRGEGAYPFDNIFYKIIIIGPVLGLFIIGLLCASFLQHINTIVLCARRYINWGIHLLPYAKCMITEFRNFLSLMLYLILVKRKKYLVALISYPFTSRYKRTVMRKLAPNLTFFLSPMISVSGKSVSFHNRKSLLIRKDEQSTYSWSWVSEG